MKEATVDGTRVLRKSSWSWFGFRRKDSSYELKTTDEGLEVTRGGKYSWGVKAQHL